MTIVRSTWYRRALSAQLWRIEAPGVVRPMPGYQVWTTRQPAVCNAATKAGAAEYITESPTIIAVPQRGTRSAGLAAGCGVVVVAATVACGVACLDDMIGAATTGFGIRSVR